MTEKDRALVVFQDKKIRRIWYNEEWFFSVDGKLRFTDCVSTKNAFRLIQSIPSKKAEPFKQWLAKVGYERIRESQLFQKIIIFI